MYERAVSRDPKICQFFLQFMLNVAQLSAQRPDFIPESPVQDQL